MEKNFKKLKKINRIDLKKRERIGTSGAAKGWKQCDPEGRRGSGVVNEGGKTT